MTSARLVIVTTNHPFRFTGGEVMFVAPELPRVVRELGAAVRITVAPLHAVGERVEMPESVELDMSLSDALCRERLTSYLRAPFWPGAGREFLLGWRRGGVVGALRVWRWAAMAQVTWRWARAFPDTQTPTLFYTYWRGGSTLALARLSAERPRMSTVTRAHRYELYEDAFDPPFQPWHSAMYDTLALTATIAQHGYDYLRAAGVDAQRLGLFRLGTEAAPRPACASDDGVLRIVSCSNASAVKRVPLIASALVTFAAQHPERRVQWTHFGDGPELAEVRRRLADAGSTLEAHLPGAVPNAAVLEHYQREPVDVFLLLSASEGLPVSIQEAAAASIPVIATDVGGVRELVSGDNGALLAAEPAPPEVVRALERVLLEGDAERRQARREVSRRRWAEAFDAEVNHTRFAQRLRALLNTLKGPDRTP